MNITDIILDAVLVCALLPVVISFASNVSGASATEQVLLGLIATFIVIGLLVAVAKQTGMGNSS